MNTEDLIGTWRLRSFRSVANDGSATYPFGEDALGFIFYNHDGYMSAALMAADRCHYDDPSPLGGTTEERAEGMRTYLSYAGPFEVLPDQETIVHHIEVTSYPNWAGVAQPRTGRLDGDVLTLTTPSPSSPQRTAQAVWERIGHD